MQTNASSFEEVHTENYLIWSYILIKLLNHHELSNKTYLKGDLNFQIEFLLNFNSDLVFWDLHDILQRKKLVSSFQKSSYW